MSELRWTLLILGVVFIAALSWWERRRPRQAFAPRLRDANLSQGELSYGDAHPRSTADPWIGEAGLSEVLSSDLALSGAAPPEAGASPGIGPLEELPTVMIPDAEEQLALKTAWDERPPEPTLIDPEAGAIVPGAEPLEAVQPSAAEPMEAIDSSAPEPEIFGAEGVGAVRIIESFAGSQAPPEPIVEWPAEETRRILALRLVAAPAERFPGRALRLAMAAEGFVLGKFSIFHKPDEANRAVLSAASLTSPGSFDLETMDSQRYGGLSLFAVLPGPKAPPQAFEELLATARNLNERLQGALQDERGGPLTPLRVASIRDGLKAEAATLQAAAAHEA